jgi:hypothetical protein
LLKDALDNFSVICYTLKLTIGWFLSGILLLKFFMINIWYFFNNAMRILAYVGIRIALLKAVKNKKKEVMFMCAFFLPSTMIK